MMGKKTMEKIKLPFVYKTPKKIKRSEMLQLNGQAQRYIGSFSSIGLIQQQKKFSCFLWILDSKAPTKFAVLWPLAPNM